MRGHDDLPIAIAREALPFRGDPALELTGFLHGFDRGYEMRSKTKARIMLLIIGIGLLGGCAWVTEARHAAANHPANPEAPAPFALTPSGILQSYKTPEAFRTDPTAQPVHTPGHPPPHWAH